MITYLRSCLFLTIAVLLFSCDEDPEPEEYIVTHINNKLWIADLSMSIDSVTDSLYITGSRPEGLLQMHVKFTGEGRYQLPAFWSKYKRLVSTDDVAGMYHIDKLSASNAELVISEYNEEENTMKGSFRFNVKSSRSSSKKKEETMRFSDGVFKGRVGIYEGGIAQ